MDFERHARDIKNAKDIEDKSFIVYQYARTAAKDKLSKAKQELRDLIMMLIKEADLHSLKLVKTINGQDFIEFDGTAYGKISFVAKVVSLCFVDNLLRVTYIAEGVREVMIGFGKDRSLTISWEE